MTLRGHGNGISQLAFIDPDRLVSGGHDGRVILWNLHDNSSEVLLHRVGGHIASLAASPAGAVAVSTRPGQVMLRRPGGAEWRTLRLRCGGVLGLAFSPDGRWLWVTGTYSYLVDLEPIDPTARLVLPDRAIGAAAFAPDGQSLGVLDLGNNLSRLDARTGVARSVRVRPESEPEGLGDFLAYRRFGPPSCQGMAWSPDGRWLAVIASWNGWFGTHVGDLRTGRWFALRPEPSRMSLSLAFQSGGSLVSREVDGGIRVWDVASQQLRATLFAAPGYPCGQVSVFSPNGDRAALGAPDGTIRLVPLREMLDA